MSNMGRHSTEEQILEKGLQRKVDEKLNIAQGDLGKRTKDFVIEQIKKSLAWRTLKLLNKLLTTDAE